MDNAPIVLTLLRLWDIAVRAMLTLCLCRTLIRLDRDVIVLFWTTLTTALWCVVWAPSTATMRLFSLGWRMFGWFAW